MGARSLLFYFCLLLSIKSIQNTQCAWSTHLAGHCGCCPLIGGSCVHLNTLDDLSMSWHLCVPEHRQKNFSLAECQPNLVMDKNLTRLCHTKNETFRLFPQCATKEVCALFATPRKCTSEGFLSRLNQRLRTFASSCKPMCSSDGRRRHLPENIETVHVRCRSRSMRFVQLHRLWRHSKSIRSTKSVSKAVREIAVNGSTVVFSSFTELNER